MKPARVTTPSETTVQVIRRFDAPVAAAWRPFTEANLMRDWMLGPPGWSMPVCEFDFRVGGAYENVFRNEADGSQISIFGHLREIVPHARIVQDERHAFADQSDSPVHESVVTFTFAEVNGSTTVTTLIEYASQAARDEALASQLEAALEMGYCRIDHLLAEGGLS